MKNYYTEMEETWANNYPSTNSFEEYESFYEESGFKGGFTPHIEKLLSQPELKINKSRLLEFGCDNGIALNYFKNHSLELYGVDLNTSAIQNGRKLFPEFNLVRSFGLEIPFKDKYFDIVFVSAVLKHIRFEDREEMYRELARVADYIIVTELNSAENRTKEQHGFTFYHSDFISELDSKFTELYLEKFGEHFLSLYKV